MMGDGCVVRRVVSLAVAVESKAIFNARKAASAEVRQILGKVGSFRSNVLEKDEDEMRTE